MSKKKIRLHKSIPTQLRFDCDGTVDLQAAEGDAEKASPRSFTMLAYNGGQMNLAGFPHPVAIDLAGMKTGQRSRPILLNHDTDKILGHSTEIQIDSAIRLAGRLSAANESAREVSASSDNGFPWRASIGASIQKASLVEEGETAQINGRELNGPLIVARRSTLKEVSFVPVAADDNTLAAVAAAAEPEGVEVTEMSFEKFVEAKGFDPQKISDEQTASLKAFWEAEQEAEKTAKATEAKQAEEVAVNDAQKIQAGANGNGKPGIVHDVEKLAAKAAVEAVSAERERVADITASCRALGVSDQEQIDKFVGLEKSPELTKAALVDHLATAEQPVYSFAAGEAAVDKFDTVCAQALELRLNSGSLLDSKEHVTEGGRQMSNGSLLEMCRESLRLSGVRTAGMSRKQVAVAALAMPTAWDIKAAGGAYHTSGSFSNLALDAANKSLRMSYEEAPVSWRSWARQAASVPDFKNINRIQLSEAPDLQVTPEDTDYAETKLSDDRAFYSIENYGKIFSITFQMILNDDLDALDRLPRLHATAAARTVNKNVYGLLTDNVTMQDSNALFDSSNHSNIVSSGGTPTVAQLGEMRELLRLQTGDSDGDGTGQILNLVMAHLIVPANLETAAEQLIASLVDPSSSNATPNLRFIRGLNLVVEPILDGSDTGIYYGASAFNQIDTIEVSFLQGDEIPNTETWWDFSRDVRKVRVRQAHAAKVIDWRGLIRNPGS